ncbi:MAG: transposase [Caldilineaceae bacterium]|nr:transposase [Caldilineaceae bacterium]
MDKIPYRRYSIAFKRQVVQEYEAGASATELRQKYGIGGGSTISNWVKQYGREGSRYNLMIIQKPEERNRVKELEERVRLLESALAEVQLENHVLNSVVAVAEQELKVDLKKTFGPKSLSMHTQAASKGRMRIR